MPIHEEEDAFIRQFIVRSQRDRCQFLLSNPRARSKFYDDLSHSLAPSLLHATEIESKSNKPEVIEEQLRSLGAGDTVYVISSLYREEPERWISLSGLLGEHMNTGEAFIACCVTGRLAYYQAEDAAYILHYQGMKG